MSWYDPAWKFRASVSLDNTAGSASATDWSLTIPESWDHFWDNTLANGYDAVITDQSGRTKLAFERQTWTHANQAGVLRTNDHSLSTTNTCHAFLYYGNSSASVDPVGSVSISSAITGEIELANPRSARPMIICRPERPGRTAPTPQIAKASTETIHVWWDLAGALQGRRTESNAHRLLEEIRNVKITVYDGASQQAAMVSATKTRIVNGRFVKTQLTAGSSGTDYTPRLTVETTENRILDFRALLQVRDVNED